MELSPFQRVGAFMAVVLVLAGLGVYLFLPHSSSAASSWAASRHRGTSPQSSSRAPIRPPPSTPASTSASADIYQWLPFTESGLASAAAKTTTFAGHYGTYAYT